MKFYIKVFFENLSRKFEFHQNRTRINSTLHYDQYTLSIISRSFLLCLKHISNVVGKHEKHILWSITFFQKSCRLRVNVEKFCRAGQVTDDNMAQAQCSLDT